MCRPLAAQLVEQSTLSGMIGQDLVTGQLALGQLQPAVFELHVSEQPGVAPP